MIYITVGGIGSGKTLFNTWFTIQKYCEGYEIYGNYRIKDIEMTSLQSLTDFDEIVGEKTLVNLDEIWISSDARQSTRNVEFTRYMLQSRKFSKNSDVICSTQSLAQVDVRIRNICHYLISPTIIASYKDSGKPAVIKVEFYNHQRRNRKDYTWKIPTVFNFAGLGTKDVCDMYDTAEYINKLEPNSCKRHEQIVKHFMPMNDLKIPEIMTMLQNPTEKSLWHGEKFTQAEAKNIAQIIKLNQNNVKW